MCLATPRYLSLASEGKEKSVSLTERVFVYVVAPGLYVRRHACFCRDPLHDTKAGTGFTHTPRGIGADQKRTHYDRVFCRESLARDINSSILDGICAVDAGAISAVPS